jgi:hypothetical protein
MVVSKDGEKVPVMILRLVLERANPAIVRGR